MKYQGTVFQCFAVMKVAHMKDGGRSALGGYLWQALGVIGLVGRSLLPADSRASSSSPLDAQGSPDVLIDLRTEDGRAIMEYLQEDALFILPHLGLDRADKHLLIQFKYSHETPPRSLSSTELHTIARKMHRSAQLSGEQDVPISAYVLLTNRHIASEETQTTSSGQGAPFVIPFEHAGVPFRAITRLQESQWMSWLHEIGRRYACTPDEIQAGIDQLVGELFGQTQFPVDRTLNKERVLFALTGVHQARPLTISDITAVDQGDFDHLYNRLNVVGEPIRRKAIETLFEQAQIRSVIGVVGLGGSGKTVTLGHWLREIRARGTTLALFRQANVVRDIQYLAQEACAWSSRTRGEKRSREDLPKILERLLIANEQSARPVFVLGLDGVDEDDIPRRRLEELRSVIHAFLEEEATVHRQGTGQQPRATLVITCREEEELKRFFPTDDLSGFGSDAAPLYGMVTLSTFSWQELATALAEIPPDRLRHSVRRRLETLVREESAQDDATLSTSSLRSPSTAFAGGQSELTDERTYVRWALADSALTITDIPSIRAPDDRQKSTPPLFVVQDAAKEGGSEQTHLTDAFLESTPVIRLLLHPVLWRSFLKLTPAEQECLLNDDDSGWRAFAKEYLHRFCEKAVRRLPGLRREQVSDALQAVFLSTCAGAGTTGTHNYDRATFLDRAAASGILGLSEQRDLYNEALSAGLIETVVQSRWRWSYVFIGHYLAR